MDSVTSVITAEQLKSVTDMITATIKDVAPVGIAGFALLLGLGLVPRVVRTFL